MKRTLLLIVIAFSCISEGLHAQKIGVKTNLVADAVLSPNVGVEVGLAPKWTLDAIGQFNGWTLSHDRRWKHWAVQPGVRYWLCDRFGGHFFGAHLHGGQYNMGGFDGKLNLLSTRLANKGID